MSVADQITQQELTEDGTEEVPLSFFERVEQVAYEALMSLTTHNFVARGPPRMTRTRPRRRRGTTTNGAPAVASSVFSPTENFNLGNNLSAFPTFLRRTLRYAQTNTLDVGNFGTAQQVFRANSLYDPDFTGTGHQPNGFDQLMVAYNHFVVTRARINVRVLNTTTGGGTIEPGAIVLGYSDSGTFMAAQADYPTCIEKRNIYNSAFYGASMTTGMQFTLSGSLDIAKLLRKTPQQLIEMANLRGDSGANPLEGYFFEVGLFSFSSNPGSVTVICDVEYDAIFTEPRFNSGDS